MRLLSILSILALSASAPLQQNSLITLRTVLPPKAGGGNTAPPPPYGPLILEEWDLNGLPLQSWEPSCTLPGLSTETWTEGHLSPRYPWGDQIWFLCRNVPVNSSLSTNPAPVNYMVLTEDGILNKCVEDFVYANGTNVLNILPYTDTEQGINVFYLLGGGTTGNGPANPARPAQPRIRVDSALCAPADTEGALLGFSQGVAINQLRILDGTLYGTGLFGSSSGGLPQPMIYQIGAEGVLPTGTRNPTANIPNFPLVLSVWTDTSSPVWWRTGFNRTSYVALYNNSDTTDLVFLPPPSQSAGTLGGTSWSVATARKELGDWAVYLTNTSHIVKNTLNGLQNGQSYQPFLQAPPGWRYLSAHARNPSASPTPSATSTATTSSTSSPSASSSASATSTTSSWASTSSSPSACPSATSQSSATSSSSASASSSSYPTSTPTATRNPNISTEPSASSTPSPSITPSTTPSNGTIPVPADNSQATDGRALTPGEEAGIGLGSIAALCIAGLALIHYTPALKNLWTRQFGSSSKGMKKGVSFRNPVVSADVPITISHNPQAMVQYRLEQLKDLQKQLSTREVSQTSEKSSMDRTKKQFGPVISGESV